MKTHPRPALLLLAAALLAPSGAASAQDETGKPAATFGEARTDLEHRLEAAVQELDDLRRTITEEKLPLGRRLRELESELVDVRLEYQETTRLLDGRTLDLSNIRSEITQRKDETTYLANLLGEYVRNFEARLHVVELQRYAEALEAARLAPENSNLTQKEVFAVQADLLATSLERLHEVLGGARFEGTVVDPTGLVRSGTITLVGPVAIFRSDDGLVVGTAEQRLGSLEPTLIPFGDARDAEAAASFAEAGSGAFPLDPTLGNAHKIEATHETFLEHVEKGGPVMIPIFALAAAALFVALFKWLGLTLVRMPSRRRVAALMEAVEGDDTDAARAEVRRIRGPVGRMLAAGVDHLGEPRELVEEAMYETVLKTRLRVHRFLPFIAISAASAPLLGLLGTVTGIINTFKLITVFGSGDVKTLSGGISEALITTKFGLIVAIPSLLLHAFLSRKAKAIVGRMETAAVTFMNHVGSRPGPAARNGAAHRPPGGERRAEPARTGEADPRLVQEKVNEILRDLLVPVAREQVESEAAGPRGRPELATGPRGQEQP